MNFNKKKLGLLLFFVFLIGGSAYAVNSVLQLGKYKWNPVTKWVQEGETMYSEEADTATGFKHSFAFIKTDQAVFRKVQEGHLNEINGQLSVLNKNIEQLKTQLGPQCVFGMDDKSGCQISLPYPCECGKHGCDTCLRVTNKGITSRVKIVCHNIEDISEKSDEEIAALHEQWEKDLDEKKCGDEGVFCGPPGYCHLRAPEKCSVDGGTHICIPGFGDVSALRDVASVEGREDLKSLGAYTEKKQKEEYEKNQEKLKEINVHGTSTKEDYCLQQAYLLKRDYNEDGCHAKYVPSKDETLKNKEDK